MIHMTEPVSRGFGNLHCMNAGRPKAFDEATVVGRAMELFWLKGYEAAGLTELLEHMGISRQSLYDTFGNKRGLFMRVIEHYRATQLSAALALLEREGSHIENVKAVVGFFEDLALDNRCRGCLVANTLVELGSENGEVADLLRDTLELLRRSLQHSLEEAQRGGELPKNKSPEKIAHALTNATIGLAVTGKLQMDPASVHDIYVGTLSMLD
jgi:TetR/AcrR family transcriptional repressor of nem operon